MSIAEKLRELKLARGLTERDLAAKAGIPFGTLHGYLLGTRKPSGENLVRLAKALKVGIKAFG